jgi:hypothetical protein
MLRQLWTCLPIERTGARDLDEIEEQRVRELLR